MYVLENNVSKTVTNVDIKMLSFLYKEFAQLSLNCCLVMLDLIFSKMYLSNQTPLATL